MADHKGFFWHVHHEVLIEWCFDYNERALYICTQKPKNEQEIRLRLFRPVKGTLPQEVIEAGQALIEAGQAYDKAWRAYWAYNETLQAYDKAWRACHEAGQAYDEALRKNMPAIKALHREECPNCPWDGKTIFPGS